MERLTENVRGSAVWAKDYDVCAELEELCNSYDTNCTICPVGRLIDRLCKYEDTGLAPESVQVLANKYILEK